MEVCLSTMRDRKGVDLVEGLGWGRTGGGVEGGETHQDILCEK